MTTIGKRGTSVIATTGTTWASTSNCVDGTYGSNDATYGTWTSSSRNVDADIEIGGFDFSSIPANSTINSVTVYLRHYESATNLFDVLDILCYDGATQIGSTTAVTLSSSATTFSTTFSPTLAQLQSANFKFMVDESRPNTATEGVFYLDYIDVLVDYTAPVITGKVKVWTGSMWAPVKVWTGSAWEYAKIWTGSQWI